MTDDKMLAIGIAVLVALAINFIPTVIATVRRHPERKLLAQLNILSILSFLLWAALLAWAIGGQRNDSVIGRFVGTPGQRGRLLALVGVLLAIGIGSSVYALLPR